MADNPLNDPLDLDAVDRKIRINELEEQARALGMSDAGVSEDCPPDVHEGFLQSVIDYESAALGTRFDQLTKAGTTLPEPTSLDDAALHAKLWEVIRTLAGWSVFLTRTDHLSDRQLYEHLWG